MISNKSNQVNDVENQKHNENQKTISGTKDKQPITLDKRIGKSNPTTAGDKVTRKERKEQIIENSRHNADKKMM